MAQVFKPSSNAIIRVLILGFVIAVATAIWFIPTISSSTYVTKEEFIRDQPIEFSHAHHVGELGIDCRYCHTSVETSAFAGIPPTETCMNCHSEIWTQSPFLGPLWNSDRTGNRLHWTRVNDLPDFVYFNHSIHVQKGIGCDVCHHGIQTMEFTYQSAPLTMKWCLNCHRNPEAYVRPKDQVFNVNYRPPGDQKRLGAQLVKQNHIIKRTDCDTCHR